MPCSLVRSNFVLVAKLRNLLKVNVSIPFYGKMDFIILLCMVCKDMNESMELRIGHANLCNYYIYFINDNPMKGALRKIRGDQLSTTNLYQSRKLSKGWVSVGLKLETKN